jgi:hypothetical protein
VRNIGIIVISVFMFGDVVTVQQAVGYGINVVGFAVYQVVKTRQGLANVGGAPRHPTHLNLSITGGCLLKRGIGV